MWQTLRDRIAAVDWEALMEPVSNDRLVALFTHPYGMAGLGALMLLSLLMKWRVTFTVIAGALAVSFLTRYTLAGEKVGPDKSLFLFAAGGVAVGAFLIYYLFIRED